MRDRKRAAHNGPMKKALAIAGGILVVLLLITGGLVGYLAYQGRALDLSSKAYVEANVPPILSSWSKGELMKRASPQLVKVLDEKPGQADQIFRKLSKLGAMREFGEVKGESKLAYNPRDGTITTASYVATAKFENGNARIDVGLVRAANEWRVLTFNVNSPLFVQ